MRKNSICVLLTVFCLFIFNNPSYSQQKTGQPIENVLTLELMFGAENLPEKYLLAYPNGIVVAQNGDVIVTDETYLKVFNKNGAPKKLLGGPGQGPGEFNCPIIYPFLSETGFLSAYYDYTYKKYNIYSSDYTFIERKEIDTEKIKEFIIKYMSGKEIVLSSPAVFEFYSPTKFLFAYDGREKKEGKTISELIFFSYFDNGNIKPIYVTTQSLDLLSVGEEPGTFNFCYLKNNRIAYTFAPVHKNKVGDKWYYSVFIYNLSTGQTAEIKNQYEQVAIPDSVIYSKKDEKRSKLLKELKYYSGVQKMITDGDYIFVFTFKNEKGKGVLVDVFDSLTGSCIRSAYFPYVMDVIRSGYAYRLVKASDIFPFVEKYTIAPAVYGK